MKTEWVNETDRIRFERKGPGDLGGLAEKWNAYPLWPEANTNLSSRLERFVRLGIGHALHSGVSKEGSSSQ
ncbi:MAG TPA: hypothetical protein VKH45_09855, partial [Candidatus Acidoferrum sp.]|nr:hypothetical protein [Candidatus Acidoferrum sp.]